ncbi:MAG: type II secretion system F family protein [Deltaproteobacteria bacterium]|nr:type II secretion system F family protein [Deltaproteobacteria bacterium]
MSFESFTLLLLSAGLLVGGCAALVYLALAMEGGPPARLFQTYAARLDRHSSFLLIPYSGDLLARAQVLVCVALLAMLAVTRSPAFALLGLLAACAPPFLLWKRHSARVAKLERQLDTWLLMLANALKASPSVGEAIASTVALVPKPFSEEVDLLVKEVRLGAPLDRAIASLAHRINSTLISGALVTIVVARQTGGDLPRTLERTSAALREAARLEGVLRTKTAEGRGQVLVLAAMPFVLCVIIAWLDRSWFDPMLHHQIGKAILVACGVVWAFATMWAHHIAKADL